MRRRVIGSLASGLLVIGAATGTAAQSASPPPWFGGRVEMPEHGFAVTLPDGWVGVDPAGDIEAQRRATVESWGSEGTWTESVDALGVLFALVGPGSRPAFQQCSIEMGPPALGFGDFPDIEIVDIRTFDIAPGIATVVDASLYDIVFLAMYLIEQDRLAILLTCSSLGFRPADDWLPIAEALEFLPGEE